MRVDGDHQGGDAGDDRRGAARPAELLGIEVLAQVRRGRVVEAGDRPERAAEARPVDRRHLAESAVVGDEVVASRRPGRGERRDVVQVVRGRGHGQMRPPRGVAGLALARGHGADHDHPGGDGIAREHRPAGRDLGDRGARGETHAVRVLRAVEEGRGVVVGRREDHDQAGAAPAAGLGQLRHGPAKRAAERIEAAGAGAERAVHDVGVLRGEAEDVEDLDRPGARTNPMRIGRNEQPGATPRIAPSPWLPTAMLATGVPW